MYNLQFCEAAARALLTRVAVYSRMPLSLQVDHSLCGLSWLNLTFPALPCPLILMKASRKVQPTLPTRFQLRGQEALTQAAALKHRMSKRPSHPSTKMVQKIPVPSLKSCPKWTAGPHASLARTNLLQRISTKCWR